MTLRARIAAAAGLAVALAVIAAAVAVYLGVRGELRGEVDDSLRQRAMAIGRLGPLGGPRPDRPPMPEPQPFEGPGLYAQVVLPDGRVLRRPGVTGELPADREVIREARAEGGEHLADTTVDDEHLRVLTVALPGGAALQVARPLDEVDRQLDRILLLLVFVGAAGVALAAALGAIVARTALAPVERFTRRTEQLAAEPDPSERMEVAGRDELARLAASFNATLDALERSVEAQRQLVADASHELRTPIASLRANVQTLGDAERLPRAELEALQADIVSELDELTALVADVVELARGESPAELSDDVRLDQIVAAVLERAGARSGMSFDVQAEPTVVRGDPRRIHRAVSNLVENAVKWSPPDRPAEVSLAGGVLSVRDHGPGFADEDLPRVFERFYRADAARGMPGSGLGLAIVRQAAEAHGGSAEAANAPGGGAVVTVSFGPAQAAATSNDMTPR